MNRPLKFRVWNVAIKTMVDLKIITSLVLDKDLKQDGLFLPFSDEIKLMQFTGLLDRNGKEIYEGDILICREMHDSNLDYWQNNEAVPFEIVWCETGFVIPSRDELMNFEVIGNIYESPELLK